MASFSEALYDVPTETLRKIVQNRRLDVKKLALIPNKRQLVQFLTTELAKPTSVSEAILLCNARELRLLQLLLGVESEQLMPWERLLAAAGGSALADALHGILGRLEELGLAFNLKSGVFLPGSVRQYVPASLSERYTLERCLDLYDAQSIKRICANLGLPQDTKGVNIQAISSHLFADGTGLHLKTPLTEEEVRVLEYMVQLGGAGTAIEVASAALEGQAEDFFRYDWQNRWKQGKERNAIDTLLARGILYVIAHGYGYNLFLIIPGDLLRSLSGSGDMMFWTGPGEVPTLLQESVGQISRHQTLARDVVALLGFLAAQEAVRTNTGHIHKTSLKNLARTLSLPDERYASFLYAVCREAELISTQGEKMAYAITPRGNSWLHWDSATQARALYEGWRKGSLWAEMYSDPLHRANDYRAPETVVRMRQAALGIIAGAEVNTNDAATNASSHEAQGKHDSSPVPDQPDQSTKQEAEGGPFYDLTSITNTLTFRYPLLLAHSASMGALVPSPATFTRLLIGECLYWLGLAELALPPATTPSASAGTGPALSGKKPARAESVYDTLLTRGEGAQKPTLPEAVGYRLTAVGALLLGVNGAVTPADEPRENQFIVQANGEIFVSPYLEPATLYHLLAMTETPTKGGTGNTVILTRESIRRCLDQGESTRDLLAFLQAHARTGIPQNVEYLINEVGGKHGHIHIGKAQMYVQVNTPMLLKELEARRELKPYFVRALSDTVALLKSDDPDKLLRELRKAGYLPVSDDAPKTSTLSLKARPAPPSITAPAEPDDKQAKRAAKADGAVDWGRIAQDDDKPWKDASSEVASSGGMLTNATRNPTLVKTLLVQAEKNHTVVEIEYIEQGKSLPTVKEIEPTRLMGGFVNAYDRSTQQTASFNISRIRSARLTGEPFASR